MFGEIPKIFDRNFVVGYALPSACFLAVSLGFTHNGDIAKIMTTWDGAAFLVAAFLIGIVLLAANRLIMRMLEGYAPFHPARILKPVQRWRFRHLRKRIKEADDKYLDYQNKRMTIPAKVHSERQRLNSRLVERYPDEERYVLPTVFGNTMRAFERYSRVMYKFDLIEGWNRLIAVIPKDYLKLIDTAKAETDLWVNLWFLSLLTIADSFTSWSFPKAMHVAIGRSLWNR